MTIITGSADFQPLFQGLLSEVANVDGQPYGIQIVKLTQDSVIGINQINELIPSAYDFVDLSYTGNNLTQAVFKQGGSGGTVVATLNLTYDLSNNLKTVTRT